MSMSLRHDDERDVIAAVGQAACERVHILLMDRGLRHEHAVGVVLVEDAGQVVEGADHVDALALVSVADEPDDAVPQCRILLVGSLQPDRVGIGADDHDAALHPAAHTQPAEDSPGDLPLGHEGRRRADREQDHPEAGEVRVLQTERDDDQCTDPGRDRPNDVEVFLHRALVGTGLVHARADGADGETGHGEQRQCEVLGHHGQRHRFEHQLEDERRRRAERQRARIGDHQPALVADTGRGARANRCAADVARPPNVRFV